MKSARVHTSREPLKVEEVPKPGMPRGAEVLVRIGGTGLCHSDLHIMQGDWASSIPVQLPKTLGHEVAGWVEEVGDSVPSSSYAGGLVKGDLVAIFGGWGCGACTQCKSGNEQLCNSARYARLTDDGLTPYRAIKKVRHLLGPGKTIAVIGLGGLGFYGMQYAKILGQGSVVIGMDRNEKRVQDITNAKMVDHVLSMSSNAPDIRKQITKVTGKGVDVIIDCVGAENTIKDAFRILNKGVPLWWLGCLEMRLKFHWFRQ